MKKTVSIVLALMLLASSALALTDDEAVSKATEAVGGTATLVRTELDDGVYEVTLSGENTRWQVNLDNSTGAILEIETVYTDAGRATSMVLIEADALAVAAEVAPEAEKGIVTSELDDGAFVYEVFYSTTEAVGAITVNAETGAIVRVETYPEALTQGILTTEEVVQKVSEKMADAKIAELELDWDDGRYVFEGEADVNGMRYSFELTALSSNATFIEWEIDD